MADVKFDIDFWKSDCEDFFQAKHKELMKHGYSSEDAQEFLECMYSVVGGEYGN